MATRAFGHFIRQLAPAAAPVLALSPFAVQQERWVPYKTPCHCADVATASPAPGSQHLIRRTEVPHKFWSKGAFEDEYQIEDQIGSGAFGVVYKARLRGTDIRRAVKMIPKKNNDVAHLENEIYSGINLDHPHITKMIRYYDQETYLYLVFELCTGPDLGQTLLEACRSRQHHMSEQDSAVAIRHMLKALNCCHGKYMGHYDVKPQNFMYVSPDRTNLKMIDLGLSSGFNLYSRNLKGTVDFIAPEVHRGVSGPEADVWSCGVILFVMLTGSPFFTGDDDSEEEMKRLTHDRRWLLGRLAWAAQQGVSAEAHSLLSQMLVQDRHLRITVTGALQHPFIQASYIQDPAQKNRKAMAVIEGLLDSFRELAAQPLLKRATKLLIAHLVGQLDQTSSQQKAFRMLDIGGNGELSVGALEQVLQKYGVKIPGDMDSLFNQIDHDGDGYISFLDILSATLSLRTRQDEVSIKAVFKLMDRNRDGFIDVADLVDALACQTPEDIMTCHNALHEACSASHTASRKDTFFLPKRLNGVPVVQHVQGNKFLVDNSKLKINAPFLGFRRSKDLQDRAQDALGPVWGSIVEAEEEGEWIKVQHEVPRISYEDFLALIKDPAQSKKVKKV